MQNFKNKYFRIPKKIISYFQPPNLQWHEIKQHEIETMQEKNCETCWCHYVTFRKCCSQSQHIQENNIKNIFIKWISSSNRKKLVVLYKKKLYNGMHVFLTYWKNIIKTIHIIYWVIFHHTNLSLCKNCCIPKSHSECYIFTEITANSINFL